MRFSVVASGSEFTRGIHTESNSNYITRLCTDAGHDCQSVFICPDDKNIFIKTLTFASEISDFIIISGGLGPTGDDLTRDVIAAFSGNKLVFNNDSWSRIEQFFKRIKKACSETNKKQAFFPENSRIIPNTVGTADGFYLDFKSTKIFCIPGVPSEMRFLMQDIKKIVGETNKGIILKYTFSGPSESLLQQELESNVLTLLNHNDEYSLCAKNGFFDLKIFIKSKNQKRIRTLMRKVLPGHQISRRGYSGWESLIRVASRKKIKFSFAESCTAGKFSSLIAGVPGASSCFSGSIISYSNKIKSEVLGVDKNVILEKGAVSKECALQMAVGAKKYFETDFAVSITGIAGPGGGTIEKPVGTVCFGLASPDGNTATVINLSGDRDAVTDASAYFALKMLLGGILKHE